MTATLSIGTKGQLVLPKKIRERAGLRPGSRVRVSSVQDGLFLSPVADFWESELRAIERATGLPRGQEPKNAAQIVKRAIQSVRRRK